MVYVSQRTQSSAPSYHNWRQKIPNRVVGSSDGSMCGVHPYAIVLFIGSCYENWYHVMPRIVEKIIHLGHENILLFIAMHACRDRWWFRSCACMDKEHHPHGQMQQVLSFKTFLSYHYRRWLPQMYRQLCHTVYIVREGLQSYVSWWTCSHKSRCIRHGEDVVLWLHWALPTGQWLSKVVGTCIHIDRQFTRLT